MIFSIEQNRTSQLTPPFFVRFLYFEIRCYIRRTFFMKTFLNLVAHCYPLIFFLRSKMGIKITELETKILCKHLVYVYTCRIATQTFDTTCGEIKRYKWPLNTHAMTRLSV